MTIAQQVANACQGTSAFTLYGGYTMKGAGEYVRFQAGHLEREKRNAKGRCVYALYSYADDSKVEYRYKEPDGTYTLTVKEGASHA